MKNNGFYAAMKTDCGVQAVYIDEASFRSQVEQEERDRRKAAKRREQAAQDTRQRRVKRAALYVAKQELKLAGMGLILWLGQRAGLVDPIFAAPVLIGFQTVICFRAGKWWGRWGRQLRAGK